MKKSIYSIAWSAGELWLVYAATFGESHGAGNAVKFMAAYGIAMTPLVLAAVYLDKTKETRPKWLCSMLNLSDLAMVAIMAWFGWKWCAAAFAIGGIVSTIYRGREEFQAGLEKDKAAKGATV